MEHKSCAGSHLYIATKQSKPNVLLVGDFFFQLSYLARLIFELFCTCFMSKCLQMQNKKKQEKKKKKKKKKVYSLLDDYSIF